jgi:hypothetical protein
MIYNYFYKMQSNSNRILKPIPIKKKIIGWQQNNDDPLNLVWKAASAPATLE